jgi:hypothetical protein
MLHPDMTAIIAREHIADIHATAGRRRLARLAACCKPSYLAERLAVLRDRLAGRTAAAACCA